MTNGNGSRLCCQEEGKQRGHSQEHRLFAEADVLRQSVSAVVTSLFLGTIVVDKDAALAFRVELNDQFNGRACFQLSQGIALSTILWVNGEHGLTRRTDCQLGVEGWTII